MSITIYICIVLSVCQSNISTVTNSSRTIKVISLFCLFVCFVFSLPHMAVELCLKVSYLVRQEKEEKYLCDIMQGLFMVCQ